MPVKTYYLVKKYTPAGGDPSIPFYIEDVSGQSNTFNINVRGDATNIEYSTDNETWSSTKPAIPANGKVYIRANATKYGASGAIVGIFGANRSYNVGGNIMSLFYGSSFTGLETSFPDSSIGDIFLRFFYNQTNLISAENLILPATTLSRYCYGFMFAGCTSLTKAPELPATTLAESCYSNMFNGCTSLTKAPLLPVTVVTSNYYNNMFNGCSSLNEIKVGATSWTNQDNWVNGVNATGTFYKLTNTNIPTGTSGIPSGWTVVNV